MATEGDEKICEADTAGVATTAKKSARKNPINSRKQKIGRRMEFILRLTYDRDGHENLLTIIAKKRNVTPTRWIAEQLLAKVNDGSLTFTDTFAVLQVQHRKSDEYTRNLIGVSCFSREIEDFAITLGALKALLIETETIPFAMFEVREGSREINIPMPNQTTVVLAL